MLENLEPQTLTDHLQLLLVALILAFISSRIASRLGLFHYLKLPQPIAITLWHVVGVFLIFLVINLAVFPMIALAWFGSLKDIENLDKISQGWLNIASMLFSAFGIIGFSLFQEHSIRESVWGTQAFKSFKQSVKDFCIGASTWLVGFPTMLVFGQIAAIGMLYFFGPSSVEQVAVRYLRQMMDYRVLFAVTAFLIVAVVPIVEEVMFRGFLQTWLRNKLGRTKAIVIASLIFSCFHFSLSQGQNNVELLVSLFALSCFLGFIYERQQSLWASIGLHVTFNAISVLALVL
jgi:membrane protease YdiL (CAAX protease family)